MNYKKYSLRGKLINIGYHDAMNEEEQVQLKILNLQGVYTTTACLFFLIVSFFQVYRDTIHTLIFTALTAMVIILNHNHKLNSAKIYWTVFLPLIIFGTMVLYGSNPHSELLFVIPIVNIYILFADKKVQIALTSFVIILSLAAFTINNLYESPLASATSSMDSISTFLVTILCISSISSIINIYTKTLRQQLQLSKINVQALEDANSDLEHFAYMTSHNLKTPLRTILGSVFLMERKKVQVQSESVEKSIQEIKTGANDMHKLINDVMEYAVFVQNELIEIEVINVYELTQNITNTVNISLNKNAVCTYSGREKIKTNLTLIKAVLQNLIENGIKYNQSDNPLIIIDVAIEDNDFLIKVTDNGIGINPEYNDKIFVIFKRLHQSTEYEGTGVGLAMCTRLLKKYGGKIWLESVLGEGTTFFVRIPMVN